VPRGVGGAKVTAEMVRRWPGMDSRDATADTLAAAARELGAKIVAADRGGASDASHFAGTIPVTIDGLGLAGRSARARTSTSWRLVDRARGPGSRWRSSDAVLQAPAD
jgi:glutamate carboxypeptidase